MNGTRAIRPISKRRNEMKRENKVWGSVCHIFASPNAAVSCLAVEAGFRCSIHYHKTRANQFAMHDGRVVIEEWRAGLGESPTLVLLGEGDVHHVPSGVWHRFRVLESGHMTEVYWPDPEGGECRADDIMRKDEGGPDDLDSLKLDLIEARLL